MKTTKNGGKKGEKEFKPLPQTFQKGCKPGPGRPKGMRNQETIFNEALEHFVKIAQSQGLDVIDPETEIVTALIGKARAGNVRAIDLYLERRFGKAVQPISVDDSNNPQTVINVINEIHAKQEDYFEDVDEPQLDSDDLVIENDTTTDTENTTPDSGDFELSDEYFEEETTEESALDIIKKRQNNVP